MKIKIRFADQIVGLFVLVSLAALLAILILMGANQRWFAQDYHFTSRFNSANGLSVGMPITLKGFQIGKISEISLNEKNQVDINFTVFDTYYEKVKKNSVLELATNPLGLGGGLRFLPGLDKGEPLAEGSFIPSMDMDEGKKLVAAKLVDIPEGGDAINNILGKIGPVMENVNTALVTINSLMGSIESTIKGDIDGPITDIMTGAVVAVGNVNNTIGNVDTTIQNVNTMVLGVNTQIQELIARIDDLVGSVHTITGNLEATTAEFRDPTGLVTKLLDPKGSVATLLDDNNALFGQINAILGGVNDTIGQFKEFSKFINSTSPQISGLLEEGRIALDKGKDVLEGVKNNPLIRGGIPATKEQPSTFQSLRDEDF